MPPWLAIEDKSMHTLALSFSVHRMTFDHVKTPDSLKTFLFLFLFFIFMFLIHGKTPDMIAAHACFGPVEVFFK